MSDDALNIVLVVPFLNEAEHLPTVLASIAAQERPPDGLLLVNDGSTDASVDVAEDFAAAHPYARVLRRPRQPRERDRMARANVWRAFTWAVEQAGPAWDVIAKTDADLRLTPDLLAEIERRMRSDPRLGIAGASIAEAGRGGIHRVPCPGNHVQGANRFYRRQCLEEISPVPAILGWDTIDEIRARLRGWRTQAFPMPAGDQLHLRRMGSYDGIVRGYRRKGCAAWSYGAGPLQALAGA